MADWLTAALAFDLPTAKVNLYELSALDTEP